MHKREEKRYKYRYFEITYRSYNLRTTLCKIYVTFKRVTKNSLRFRSLSYTFTNGRQNFRYSLRFLRRGKRAYKYKRNGQVLHENERDIERSGSHYTTTQDPYCTCHTEDIWCKNSAGDFFSIEKTASCPSSNLIAFGDDKTSLSYFAFEHPQE